MMKRVIHIRPHWCERVPSSQWMCHHRCMTYTPSLPSLSGSPTSSPSPTAPPALSPPNRPLPDRLSLNLPSPGQSPFPGPGTSPPAQSGRAQPQSQGSSKPSPHPGLPGLPIPSGTSPRLPAPPDASSPMTASAYVLGKNWHFTYRIVHESIKSCSLPSAIASARRMRPSGQAVQGNSTGRRSILCPRRPSPSKTQ